MEKNQNIAEYEIFLILCLLNAKALIFFTIMLKNYFKVSKYAFSNLFNVYLVAIENLFLMKKTRQQFS